MDSWTIAGIPSQTEFYARNVKTVTDAHKKIAVIISDALRYEVAEEFCRKLNEQSRWTASMAAQLSTLPSYTQLGMAALLPHTDLSLDTRSIIMPLWMGRMRAVRRLVPRFSPKSEAPS